MSFVVYILQSEKSDRYYIGQTHDLLNRLVEHNSSDNIGHTRKEQPWKLVWHTEFETRSEAMLLEKKIKKRGAKRFLEDLTKAQSD